MYLHSDLLHNVLLFAHEIALTSKHKVTHFLKAFRYLFLLYLDIKNKLKLSTPVWLSAANACHY